MDKSFLLIACLFAWCADKTASAKVVVIVAVVVVDLVCFVSFRSVARLFEISGKAGEF